MKSRFSEDLLLNSFSILEMIIRELAPRLSIRMLTTSPNRVETSPCGIPLLAKESNMTSRATGPMSSRAALRESFTVFRNRVVIGASMTLFPKVKLARRARRATRNQLLRVKVTKWTTGLIGRSRKATVRASSSPILFDALGSLDWVPWTHCGKAWGQSCQGMKTVFLPQSSQEDCKGTVSDEYDRTAY